MAGDIELNIGPMPSLNGFKARGLFIAHLNVHSLLGKLDELKLLITSNNSKSFDVLTLSETWLNTSISDAEIHISGYTCIRKDRPGGKRGGGTMAYIRNGLPFRVRDDLNTNDVECLWFEIVRNRCKPLLICSIYRPPDVDNI
jgi:exonuclease III